MDEIKTGIIVCSFLMSVLALIFTRRSWHESNRPVVTAEITTHSGGNMAVVYNLNVHNTGSRPAIEIRLHAVKSDIKSIFSDGVDDKSKNRIEKCFSDTGIIPLLHHGNTVTNSFGSTAANGDANVLVYGAVLPIQLTYKDLNGKKYRERQSLFVKDTGGFAGSWWEKSA